jgi:hypothetical protein
VKALDQVIRDRIAPNMKRAGFSRKGRLFWRESPLGDRAFLWFSPFTLGQHEAEFFVEASIQPAIYVELLTRTGERPLTAGDALWTGRIPMPGKHTLALRDHWSFDGDDDTAVEHLADLVGRAVPRLLHLLDRENLLAYVRDPSTRPQEIRIQPRENAVTLLLAGQGPSDELERRVVALEAADPADPLAAFIRARATARRTGPASRR